MLEALVVSLHIFFRQDNLLCNFSHISGTHKKLKVTSSILVINNGHILIQLTTMSLPCSIHVLLHCLTA